MRSVNIDWKATSENRITQLVSELKLLDGVVKENSLSAALTNPARLRKLISEYKANGRRNFEAIHIVEHLLKKHDFDVQRIADEIDMDRTSVERALKPDSHSTLTDKIRQRFREELLDRNKPTDEEVWIEGACHAIRQVRADLFDMHGQPDLVGPPVMHAETFCYVWHTLAGVEWQRALKSGKPEEFEHAATSVYQRVVDPRLFPTYASQHAKPAQSISGICEKWDVAFFLAVYSTVDVLKFST